MRNFRLGFACDLEYRPLGKNLQLKCDFSDMYFMHKDIAGLKGLVGIYEPSTVNIHQNFLSYFFSFLVDE